MNTDLAARHDALIAELYRLGGPLEMSSDLLADSGILPSEEHVEPVLGADGQYTYKEARIDPELLGVTDKTLAHRIACLERFLPPLRAEAEAKAKEKAAREEQIRRQNAEFAQKKAAKEAEGFAEVVKIKAVSWLVDEAIEEFKYRSPAGFTEWLKHNRPSKIEEAGKFGWCFKNYLCSLLCLMKQSSATRKDRRADAVLERVVALHGVWPVDSGEQLPSTIAQFDDAGYTPPFYYWQSSGYGEGRYLKRWGDEYFLHGVNDALKGWLADSLPTPLDPPHDVTERLLASATVRAAEEVADATEVDWIVRGLIQKGTVVLVTAKPKVGKSFLTTDLTLALAGGGKEWMGLKIVPGQHVLYLNAEGAMSQRLAAYRKHHGSLPPNFHTMSLKVKLDAVGMAVLTQQIDAHEDEHGKVDVLVIDPLARALRGSEVSDKDMAEFIDNVESMTGERTVIVVHHLGKDESAGPRGHSSLSGAVTAELRLTLDPKTGIRVISVPFVREAEEWEGARFRLAPVELGKDKFGEPVQSAVVERVGGAAKDALPKMGKNQRAVYAALRALVAEIGVADEAGVLRVPLRILIDRVGDKLGIADPKRRPERVRDALTKMDGLLGFDGESAWLLT